LLEMSSVALVSVDEYLRRSEKPHCEYVDGILHPKAMPTTVHALIQFALSILLRRQGIQALSEVTVRINAAKFLIPDVVAATVIQRPYPTEPVLLCVEILSPSDRLGAMLAKCEQYHDWGVPFCWVIDPDQQTAWQYHAGGEPLHVERGGELVAGELKVSLEELFSEDAV